MGTDFSSLKFNNGFGGFDTAENEYVIYAPTPLPWINCVSAVEGEPFGFIISERGGGYVWHGNSREGFVTKWYCDPAEDPSDENIAIKYSINSGDTGGGYAEISPFADCTVRHGFGYSTFTGSKNGISWELTVFVPLGRPVKATLLSVKADECDTCFSVEYSVNSVYEHAVYAPQGDKKIRIKKGDSCGIVFLLARNENSFEGLQDVHECGSELERVKIFWKRRVGGIRIKTPDESLNIIMNGWLLYQTISCRLEGRTAFYQCGGAYGFRDQLQDSLALLYTEPASVRARILLHASRQYEEGDVQHWWHPPENLGIRSRYSDDLLWLVYVTYHYIEATGDKDILSEQVPFITSRPLDSTETDRCEISDVTERTDTLFSHCLLACRRAMRFGTHGLPLINGGDWNDGMNRVGINGKGESVWLGWFLCVCIRYICRMSRMYPAGNILDDKHALISEADRIACCIEKHAWDGGWYMRAFCDSGRVLGSSSSSECTIDSIAQSWAVISDCGNTERAETALLSAERFLVDYENGVIKLLTPPFTENSIEDVGYIASYPPGIRENGAQYTHAAVWLAKAFLSFDVFAGRPSEELISRGRRLIDMLNPINHSRTQFEAAKYKTEPYAVAADIYSGENIGRGGWSWYTGSSAWLYTTILEDLLGLHVRNSEIEGGAELVIYPHVSPQWNEYTIEYRYKSSLYVITFRRGAGSSKNGSGDGGCRSERVIPLRDDGRVHEELVCIF